MGGRGEGLLRGRGTRVQLRHQRGLRRARSSAGRRRADQDRGLRDVRGRARRRRRELRVPLGHVRGRERASWPAGDHGVLGGAVRHRRAARISDPASRGARRGADRGRLPLREPLRDPAGPRAGARSRRGDAQLRRAAQRAPGRAAAPRGRGRDDLGSSALHRRGLRVPHHRRRHVHDRVPGHRDHREQGRRREVLERAAPGADGDRPAPGAVQALPPAGRAGELPGPGGRAGVRDRGAYRVPALHAGSLRRDPALDRGPPAVPRPAGVAARVRRGSAGVI